MRRQQQWTGKPSDSVNTEAIPLQTQAQGFGFIGRTGQVWVKRGA